MSELQDLLADAKQGLIGRRQARRQAGSRIGCGCGSCVRGTACENSLLTAMARSRSALAKEGQCYTCELLNRDVDGPHEHPYEDLVAAELAERGVRPYRSRALWDLVASARASGPPDSGHSKGTPIPERTLFSPSNAASVEVVSMLTMRLSPRNGTGRRSGGKIGLRGGPKASPRSRLRSLRKRLERPAPNRTRLTLRKDG